MYTSFAVPESHSCTPITSCKNFIVIGFCAKTSKPKIHPRLGSTENVFGPLFLFNSSVLETAAIKEERSVGHTDFISSIAFSHEKFTIGSNPSLAVVLQIEWVFGFTRLAISFLILNFTRTLKAFLAATDELRSNLNNRLYLLPTK